MKILKIDLKTHLKFLMMSLNLFVVAVVVVKKKHLSL